MLESDPTDGLLYAFNLPPNAAMQGVGSDDGIAFRPSATAVLRVLWPLFLFALLIPFIPLSRGMGRLAAALWLMSGVLVVLTMRFGTRPIFFVNRFGFFLARPRKKAFLWIHVLRMGLKRPHRRRQSLWLVLMGKKDVVAEVPLHALHDSEEAILYCLHFSTHAPSRLGFYGFDPSEAESFRQSLTRRLDGFEVRRALYEPIPTPRRAPKPSPHRHSSG